MKILLLLDDDDFHKVGDVKNSRLKMVAIVIVKFIDKYIDSLSQCEKIAYTFPIRDSI